MDREQIKRMLKEVRSGKLGVDAAMEKLKLDPVDRLGFATLDLHRAVRRGFPEVIYGPGKSADQIIEIVRRQSAAGQTVIVTRVSGKTYDAVKEAVPGIVHHPEARMMTLQVGAKTKGRPGVTVVTAGTSDMKVAEEAAITAEMMGQRVKRIYDVGVAGIHRLMEHHGALVASRVIVVVAGMEGALPSVVTGLTDCPVIGVPTSVGYGAGRPGEAALLAMLNSCASGLTVVNIDNGFGAGYAAALINRSSKKKQQQ